MQLQGKEGKSSEMAGIKIITGLQTDEDLKAVAALHSQCISRSFLSQLGDGFLFYLYKTLSECDSSILVVAKYGSEVVGFISGGTRLGSIYKYLLRHYFVETVLALAPAMFSLSKIKRIIEILVYPRQEDVGMGLPNAELLSLAVRADFRRTGVAKKLYHELVGQFSRIGVSEFRIIVGGELSEAQRFYEKMGAIKAGIVEIHEGCHSLAYRVSI